MADVLLDLLDARQSTSLNTDANALFNPTTRSTKLAYLSHLADQSPEALASTEPQSLAQTSHSLLLSLQGVSKRSHKSIIDSASNHTGLTRALPTLVADTADLRNAIPKLESEALRFSTTYSKSRDNEDLAERKRALLLLRNVERLVDVLELPTLLSSAINTVPANYASALDLNAHIRRLHGLYSSSPLVDLVSQQADEAIVKMTADLIAALKSPGLKLAASLRTISWLRRVLPDMSSMSSASRSSQEHTLSLLFLCCRVATLDATLGALQPLRELADDERQRQQSANQQSWSGGQQTEKYLKRYVEIFREQSFSVVSMFKSIFPSTGYQTGTTCDEEDPFRPMPSTLSTFPLHLVEMLLETLTIYLPVVKDQAARDSILTQVLEVAAAPNKIQTLWRGTIPSALRTGFGSALYFTSLNSIRQHVAQSRLLSQAAGNRAAHSSSLPTLTPSANLIAGAVARTFAGFVLMPLTVIKVRYESNLYSYKSLLGASSDIYRTNGPRGFFAGFGATAVRDAPYAGMYVLFYELLKKQLSSLSTRRDGHSPNRPVAITTSHATLVNFSSAVMAGGACSVISNPFDAIKTRIQLQPAVYRNMYQACQKMVSEEGIRSLMDGVALRMSRKAMSSALAWTVYEELMRRAERTWSSNLTTTTTAEP
ncbi:Dor1-like family protein [Colletotrichum scovillei]|uniref:Mitochondrial glycine transporter n=1 Tax=Colletotrichum scovillei TaxID=1209932 RepID=A0A9P7RK84_9PEZI|nr:Dor1-like family protein [Colletotrichum scovillei]KAG7077303.1 Dor1-like family protein [Colletotrichum scovillei]KAG7084305.1 Dor1-like family protein [Colletotrichum scovillei]